MLTPCCPFIPPPPPERPGARSGEGGGPSQSSNIGVFDHTNYLKWGWGLKSRNNRLDGSNKKVYSSSLLRWASNVCVFDHTNYLKWRWGLILTIIKNKISLPANNKGPYGILYGSNMGNPYGTDKGFATPFHTGTTWIKPYRSQMGTIWVLFWIWLKCSISSQHL